MNIQQILKGQVRNFLIDHYPKLVIDLDWPREFGHKIDWKNPRDINEKIQWLICYSDTNEWTRLADKYRVRDFVKERGLEHILTRLYGVWDNAQDISFDDLPDKFVLKCNHDSGSTLVVDRSKKFNKEQIISFYNDRLKKKFGYKICEPHYNKIKPLVLAEECLEDNIEVSKTSLVDYKVWAFNGRVKAIWVCHNRTSDDKFVNVYDLNWSYHPEYSVFYKYYRDGKGSVPRPKCLKEMIHAASVLSKGFPQVRVDFYIVGERLYFGEMTFTGTAGRMKQYTEDFLKQLGDEIELPPKQIPIKF